MSNVLHQIADIASILAAPAAIMACFAFLTEWGRKMLPYKRTILSVLVAIAVALPVIDWANRLGYFGVDTFAAGWPDAIRCEIGFAGVRDGDNSEFIFYFNGIRRIKPGFSVAGYFIAGGFNSKENLVGDQAMQARPGTNGTIGYSPHELWFRIDTKKLITPDDLKNENGLTGTELVYKRAFLVRSDKPETPPLKCGTDKGDNSITDIVASKNAFYFAKKM